MKEKKYIVLWGEHVELKSFLLGLLIQVVLLVVALLIPVKNKDYRLVIGLVAIIVGLIINTIWIKPKRNVNVIEVNSDDN